MTTIYRVGRLHFANPTDAYDSVAADELRSLREQHTPPEDTKDGYDDGYGELADQFEAKIEGSGSHQALAWLGLEMSSQRDPCKFTERVECIHLEHNPVDLKTRKRLRALASV